jgi:hypothetical protein
MAVWRTANVGVQAMTLGMPVILHFLVGRQAEPQVGRNLTVLILSTSRPIKKLRFRRLPRFASADNDTLASRHRSCAEPIFRSFAGGSADTEIPARLTVLV